MKFDFLHVGVAIILMTLGISLLRAVVMTGLALVFRALRMPAGYYLFSRLLNLAITLGIPLLAIASMIIASGTVEPGPETSVYIAYTHRAWAAFVGATDWVIAAGSNLLSR